MKPIFRIGASALVASHAKHLHPSLSSAELHVDYHTLMDANPLRSRLAKSVEAEKQLDEHYRKLREQAIRDAEAQQALKDEVRVMWWLWHGCWRMKDGIS